MTWTPLSDRLDKLPLILAGPILRRTEPEAVTVWVALKAACSVYLEIYATEGGTRLGGLVGSGSCTTVALGTALHVVAVSAKPTGSFLQPGQVYAYDLKFGKDYNLEPALHAAGVSAGGISYFDHQLPTFSLPPADLNQLQILHGSCRKAHGGGQDTLPILDSLIQHSAALANTRPHQLFFTGDQVYGDEVADPFLALMTDAAETLLGWDECLPLGQNSQHPQRVAQLKTLKPGHRSQVAHEFGGFTAGLTNKPQHAKSHLFGLGEYSAAYLLAWSPVLWPQAFPQQQEIDPQGQSTRQWHLKVAALQEFQRTLWKVRRSLANVPTYMIFDDHDISDDWYLNRAWCTGVLGKPLGRRVVQNGLLAYALFQAWGNTPGQFQPGQPGEKLLVAAQKWSASAGTDPEVGAQIAAYLGLPAPDPNSGLPLFKQDQDLLVLDREPLALDWHYIVRSHNHEVLVLDTRTWRGYPPEPDAAKAPPRLLSPSAFKQQIQIPLAQTAQLPPNAPSRVTLVVAPTNLISLRIIDLVQTWDLQQGNVFNNDVGDAWNLNKIAFAQLLATLFAQRDRVVVLSGDIHYGYAACLNYWTHPQSKTPDSHVLVQLTASPLKNAEWKTQLIHTKLKSVALEQPQDWVGWQQPPQLVEIQVMEERSRQITVEVPEGPVIKEIQPAQGNGDLAWHLAIKDSQSEPDWRYQVQWSRRGAACPLAWESPLDQAAATPSPLGWFQNRKFGLSWLWRNRWFQEGEEVVGQNNLGRVSFWGTEDLNQPQTVIQDLYWYCPWNPTQVLASRYRVALPLKPPPPPIGMIGPFLNKP